MEDARIVELFWARDEDAIKETDAVYGRRLNALARNILQSREDAECSDMEDVLHMLIGTGENPVQMKTIQGCTGAVLQNGASASVVWLIGTSEKGTAFRLSSSSFTAEALLPIAESVQLQ